MEYLLSRGLARTTARAPAASAAVVAETEPNNSAAQANDVNLGDQATGAINPAEDVDYFAFTADAGTVLNIDVDAQQVGSSLDPTLELFDRDGVTSLRFNDDFDGLDSRIIFTVTVTGRYFIAIRDFTRRGGPNFTYRINFATGGVGPGDPTTVFASGFAGPVGVAFDGGGNLFIAEFAANQVSRVAADGSVTVFARNIPQPTGLAFDGFGNLLVAAGGDGNVYKVSSGGTARVFLRGFTFPIGIATGPDGSIWVASFGDGILHRFDAFGAFVESFDLGSVVGPFFVAFSPAGELFFSNGFEAIYKLVEGQPVLFARGERFLEGLAFDVEGNLYVANERRDRVILYGPDGNVLADPFAFTNMVNPVSVVFGRNPDGATNARLFAADFFSGDILEMNPAGIRAPGLPVGVSLLVLAKDTLRRGVMGADYADTLTVTDADVSPTWSIVSGSLPPGIDLAIATGVLSGVPEDTGTFRFRARAQAGQRFGEKDYAVTVVAPRLRVADVADELLGLAGVLTAAELRFLDLAGNRNGRFDVGDFRAFLVAGGILLDVTDLAEARGAQDERDALWAKRRSATEPARRAP